MLDTDHVMTKLRAQSGTMLVADLGLVHQGKVGYAECRTATGIELWEGMYFVWISVVHQKNRAGRHTSIVKWPYSRTAATDLDPVLADLRAVENLATAAPRPADTRSWFARGLDKLIGREHLGEYRFTSPLPGETSYGAKVKATVARMGGQLEVSLTEGRSAGVIVLAQFPHAACASIRQALTDYASGRER